MKAQRQLATRGWGGWERRNRRRSFVLCQSLNLRHPRTNTTRDLVMSTRSNLRQYNIITRRMLEKRSREDICKEWRRICEKRAACTSRPSSVPGLYAQTRRCRRSNPTHRLFIAPSRTTLRGSFEFTTILEFSLLAEFLACILFFYGAVPDVLGV